ncbi:uncharacterized protein LOC113353798 [Papaver somniferum]|uniref:uncharacterized protein LOC113353798 n=1 Tax=Papaver somniferum TaxID=3469 RepID=UPI000E6FE8F9|nr:uncharacterized protein LOC113353798 [Papaver somniferum]
MVMRRVRNYILTHSLLKGGEGVRNFFANPAVVKTQNVLKYEAEIVKKGDLAKQKLEDLKAEFRRHQKLSAECKAKHGAADKFKAVIVGTAVAVYAYHISQKHANLQALKQENMMFLEQRRGPLADH